MTALVIPIDEVLEMMLPELGIAQHKDKIEAEKRQGATHVIFNKDSDRADIGFQYKRID